MAHVYVHVRACARMCVVSEIKDSFQSLRYLSNFFRVYAHIAYIHVESLEFFFMWDYFSIFICAGDVEHPIARFNHNHQ